MDFKEKSFSGLKSSKESLEQKTLLIEIGHEEMPEMVSFLGFVRFFFDELKKNHFIEKALNRISKDEGDDDFFYCLDFICLTPRRTTIIIPKVQAINFATEAGDKDHKKSDGFDGGMVTKEKVSKKGPKIHEKPGMGLVKAYRGFLNNCKEEYKKTVENFDLDKMPDEEIVDFVHKKISKEIPDEKPQFYLDLNVASGDRFLCFGCIRKKESKNNIAIIEQHIPVAFDQAFKRFCHSVEGADEGRMFWGNGEGAFIRPIRNICAMLGEKLLSFEIFGVKSCQTSFSHRIFKGSGLPHDKMGGLVVPIKNADDYLFEMRKHGVFLLCFDSSQTSFNVVPDASKNLFVDDDKGINKEYCAEKPSQEIEKSIKKSCCFDNEYLEIKKNDTPKDFSDFVDLYRQCERNIFSSQANNAADKNDIHDDCLQKSTLSKEDNVLKPYFLLDIYLPLASNGFRSYFEFILSYDGDYSRPYIPLMLIKEWLKLCLLFNVDAKKEDENKYFLGLYRYLYDRLKQKNLKILSLKEQCDFFEKQLFSWDFSSFYDGENIILEHTVLSFRYENPKFFPIPLDLDRFFPEEMLKVVFKTQHYFPVYIRRFYVETAKNEDFKKLSSNLELREELFPVCLGIADTPYHVSEDIKAGHKRVLKARLEDIDFFYKKDMETGIENMRDQLKDIDYFEAVGSYADVVEYMHIFAEHLQKEGFFNKIDEFQMKDLKMAIDYCKIDLASEIVNECPELSAIMGAYYLEQNLCDKAGKKNQENLCRLRDIKNPIAQAIYYQNFQPVHLLDKNTFFNLFYFYWTDTGASGCKFEKMAAHYKYQDIGCFLKKIEKWDFSNSFLFQDARFTYLPAVLWYVNKFCEIILLYAAGLRPSISGDKYGVRQKVKELVEMACLKGWTINLNEIRPFIENLCQKIFQREHKKGKSLPSTEEIVDYFVGDIQKAFVNSALFFDLKGYWSTCVVDDRPNIAKKYKMISFILEAILNKSISQKVFDTNLIIHRFYQLREIVLDEKNDYLAVFEAYLIVFKRVQNMLKHCGEDVNILLQENVEENLLDKQEEKDLYKKHLELEKKLASRDDAWKKRQKQKKLSYVSSDCLSGDNWKGSKVSLDSEKIFIVYDELKKQIIGKENNIFMLFSQYIEPLKFFFDGVNVKSEDKSLYLNRLRLLVHVEKNMSCFVDLNFLKEKWSNYWSS